MGVVLFQPVIKKEDTGFGVFFRRAYFKQLTHAHDAHWLIVFQGHWAVTQCVILLGYLADSTRLFVRISSPRDFSACIYVCFCFAAHVFTTHGPYIHISVQGRRDRAVERGSGGA
jgi:hypothetical protein